MAPDGLSREDRYAEALRLAAEYRGRQAAGAAEPLEEFLSAHTVVRRQLAALLATGTVPPSAAAAPRASKAPSAIGPYRIVSCLGAGGMGTVWLAERQDPEHRVALKVIRRGLDSDALVAHFQQERKALARMNHDAIAKVFDFGTTDDGEPYFAMELVEHGTPLTTYCDARALSLRERIELFQRVCDGVQHAHLKGVVHRDLKPGNVLVAPQGAGHVVKIIDFGIAGELAPDPNTPDADRPVGTPEYMSPEQAAGEAKYIDSRTDVYSLGVVLYELLSGALPFASAELRGLPTVSLRQRLRDEIPPRPSTRIATDPECATTSGAARGITARRLQRSLRGDLDWIVQKAIAKDPNERYATPRDLALDLQRHIDRLPVTAAPDHLTYRFGKFVSRHRGMVAASTLVALALGGGVAATLRQFWLAERRANQVDQLAGLVLYDRALALRRELDPPWPSRVADMERWLADVAPPVTCLVPRVEATLAELRAKALPDTAASEEPGKRTVLRFPDPGDQYLHQALSDLQQKLDGFAQSVAVVERQRDWARALPQLTAHHPRAGISWQQAGDAIACDENYRNTPLSITPDDLVGLVPMGANPATGLWEFYDLLTGWDFRSPPERIVVPRHDANGRVVDGDPGLVFVLVPGAPTTSGRPAAPAFLFARTDLDPTQRWRLMTWSNAERMPDHDAKVIAQTRRSHPLDATVTKTMLRKHGMGVPTPEQIERLQRLQGERPALARCLADPESAAASDFTQRATRDVQASVSR